MNSRVCEPAGTGPMFVCGPTASGKSALALEMAEKLGGEIVNADAFQLYRGLEIVTAAPPPLKNAPSSRTTSTACSIPQTQPMPEPTCASRNPSSRKSKAAARPPSSPAAPVSI